MDELANGIRRAFAGISELCYGTALLIGGVTLWGLAFGVAPSVAQVGPYVAVMPGIAAVPFLAAGLLFYIGLRAFGIL